MTGKVVSEDSDSRFKVMEGIFVTIGRIKNIFT
jgi:hypothetical protein